MRRFHSYGPVDCEEHFCVPRTGLVQECLEQEIDQVVVHAIAIGWG